MSMKAAIYSGTRRSIAFHEAPMQIGIRKAVSMISISAMPSMPSAHAGPPPKRDIFDELPLRAAGVVGAPQPGAERQLDERRDQRDPPRRLGLDEQARRRGEQREQRPGW